MKLTEQNLRQIIQEELRSVLDDGTVTEARAPMKLTRKLGKGKEQVRFKRKEYIRTDHGNRVQWEELVDDFGNTYQIWPADEREALENAYKALKR